MEKPSPFDFVTSIVLMLIALGIMVDSYRMAVAVGGEMYASPGMLPMVLAILLMITSACLLKRSIKANGVRQNFNDFTTWAGQFVQSKMAREMLLGGVILAIYTFILLPRMPFWASTAIFMVSLMAILKATSFIKNITISACIIAGVYAVFEKIFHVPLP